MSRYRKIEVTTWSDEKFRALTPIPPCGQGLWFYLLTGPHTGPIPGLFRAGRAGLAEDLGWDLKGFTKAFEELSSKGMVKADFDAKVVWIPNALKFNPPGSPNVLKGWGKHFDIIPESHLKQEAFALLKAFAEASGPKVLEAFQEGFAKDIAKAAGKAQSKVSPKQIPKSSRNQEQEQEQDQDQDSFPSHRKGLGLGSNYTGHGSVDTAAERPAAHWTDELDDIDGDSFGEVPHAA